MQPVEIRKRAVFNDSHLKMSSNNCRDGVYFLRDHGILRSVQLRKKAYLRYELTDLGQRFRDLLIAADVSVPLTLGQER